MADYGFITAPASGDCEMRKGCPARTYQKVVRSGGVSEYCCKQCKRDGNFRAEGSGQGGHRLDPTTTGRHVNHPSAMKSSGAANYGG